jgi:hypothetical protein
MNYKRKESAVKRHFTQPYQSLEELKAGLAADESEYTEEEIAEIVEAIRLKAEEASKPAGDAKASSSAQPEQNTHANATPEELEAFYAWKASQHKPIDPPPAMNAQSTAELAKAVAAPSRYADFDVFVGNIVKEAISNPFNPSQPNVIILHIDLGKQLRWTRIEPHMARDFNELAIGQETGLNHGEVSTAQFYFPKGTKKNGDQVSFAEFAAFMREDNRYAEKYHPKKNMHLLHAAGYGASIV